MKIKLFVVAQLLAILTACEKSETPQLRSSFVDTSMDDFVYTNNGYLLLYKNSTKNAKFFSISLKSEKGNSLQPLFPLSFRDSLFASNLTYVIVGKEGESWLLFDKGAPRPDGIKRYKLIKYDMLQRTTEKTYYLLPISGRDFSNIADLQIDEKNEMMIYIDKKKNDFATINLKDGTFKSFTLPAVSQNPIVSSLLSGVSSGETDTTSRYKIALNGKNGTLYIANQANGTLYEVKEKYIYQKQFSSRDIQSQLIKVETKLDRIVDMEFDIKARPIIATSNAIYIIKGMGKYPLVKNFRYGEISAMSYTEGKVYFGAKSKKYSIYCIGIQK